MTEAKAYELVSAIYALFGRQCPARTSPVVTAITTNTAEIPDTVSGYVYERFKLLDSLPQELCKEDRKRAVKILKRTEGLKHRQAAEVFFLIEHIDRQSPRALQLQ